MRLLTLAARQLRREWRLPELRTLAAALVLAVVALGVVATLAARVERGVVASAAQLIGGDAGVSGPAPAASAFVARATALGLRHSRNAAFPSVAFVGDRSQLLDVTAADRGYPLRGRLQLRAAGGSDYDGHGPATGEVYLDHRALVALGVRVGQRVQLGGRELIVAAELRRQPDGGQLLALAPRAVMSLADARAAGLLGIGSRARHRLLVAGAPAAVARWLRWAKAHMPHGDELLTPARTQQQMRDAFARARSFLQLTALLSALLAGVAIALAARRYARRKTDEVALLRALGTPRRQVLALLLALLAGLGVPAVALGAGLAWGLAALAWQFADNLVGPVPTLMPWQPALAAAAVGLAVLAGFALPPMLRLADVPPAAVFQRALTRRVRRFDLLYLLPVAVAAALIAALSDSLQLALVLAASLAGVAMLAMALTALILWLARRLAPGAHPSLRLGLASLARRRALSLLQSTALALGLTALLTLSVVAPALLDGWRHELPADTPNWFVLNLQDNQRQGFQRQVNALGGSRYNALPLAVGKLVAINGIDVDRMHFADRDSRRWADRQLRLSWARELPPSNRVVAGHWFGAHPTTPQVSIDQRWQKLFHLKLGDTLRFQVGEATLDARVSSVRKVDWASFRVNFFLLLDPAHADGLPHTWIASFHLPPGHAAALAGVARERPNLSLIDVDTLLDRIREIIGRVSAAVRWVLGFSLLAGALVLAAALAASAQERRHEAALLRTLGAHRRQLRAAAACEFAVLGLAAGLTAAVGAAGAGLWLGRSVFHIDAFVPPLGPIAWTALGTALAVMLLGLAGTRRVARTPPLNLLRRG